MQVEKYEEIRAKFLLKDETNIEELNQLNIEEILYLLTSIKSGQRIIKVRGINIEEKMNIFKNAALMKLEEINYFEIAFSKETNNPYIDEENRCFICLDKENSNTVKDELLKRKVSMRMNRISKSIRKGYLESIDRFGIKYLVINGTRIAVSDIIPKSETSYIDENEKVKNPKLVNSIIKYYQIKENGFFRMEKYREYKRLRNQILRQAFKGKYIVPTSINSNDEKKLDVLCINDEDGMQWIPAFTDMREYLKIYEGNEEVTTKLLYYEDFLKLKGDVNGVIINSKGNSFLIDKDTLIEAQKLKHKKQIEMLYGMEKELVLDIVKSENYPDRNKIEGANIDEKEINYLADKFLSNRSIYLEEIEKLKVEQLILLIFLSTEIINGKTNRNISESVKKDYENVRATFMEILIEHIKKCEKLYVLISKITSYPYVDEHGRSWLFSSCECARNMQMNLESANVKVEIAEITLENKIRFFKELHRLGIDEIAIGNLKNCVITSKDTLLIATDWSKVKPVNVPVENPRLINASMRFFELVKSGQRFRGKNRIIESLEKKMIIEISKADFLVPIKLYEDNYYIKSKTETENTKLHDKFYDSRYDDEAEEIETPKITRKATMISYAEICDTEKNKWIPAFSDIIEFRKSYNEDEWGIKVLSYDDLSSLALNIEGIAMDFKGVNLSINKSIMNKIEDLKEEVKDSKIKDSIEEIENTLDLPDGRQRIIEKIQEEESKNEISIKIKSLMEKIKEIDELKIVLESSKGYLEAIERNQPIMIEYDNVMFKKVFKNKHIKEFKEYKEAEEALEAVKILNRSDYNRKRNLVKRLEQEVKGSKNSEIMRYIKMIDEVRGKLEAKGKSFAEENFDIVISRIVKSEKLKLYKIHKVFPDFEH